MANLVQEALARRDAGPAQGPVSGRASYQSPREREAARKQDALGAYRNDVLAQKAAAEGTRADHLQRLGDYKDARLQQIDTEQAIQRATRELEDKQRQLALDKTLSDINDKKAVLDHAEKWRAEAGKVDLASPTARRQLTELALKYPKYHSDPDSRAIDDRMRAELDHNQKIAEAVKTHRAEAAVATAHSQFNSAQSGLVSANAEADAFKADPKNKGLPLPPSIAAKIARYESQVPLAGKQLATLDPNAAPDVDAAVKESQNASLLRQHGDLESQLKDAKGNWITDPAAIANVVKQINPVKAKLGFEPLGPNGKPISDQALAVTPPALAPAPDVVAPGVTMGAPSNTIIVPADAPSPTEGTNGTDATNGGVIPVAVPTAAPTPDLAASSTDASPSPADSTPAKLNPLTDDIVKSARAAIASGKDAAAVAKRLQENGFDPSGL